MFGRIYGSRGKGVNEFCGLSLRNRGPFSAYLLGPGEGGPR